MQTSEQDLNELVNQTKRLSRNESEKKRRDQFNHLINELINSLGHCNGKMDKSSVLQTTIEYLKLYKSSSSTTFVELEKWKPVFMNLESFYEQILSSVNEFLLVTDATGQILFVSQNVCNILRHLPQALTNRNLIDIVEMSNRVEIQNKFQVCLSGSLFQFNCRLKRRKSLMDTTTDGFSNCNFRGECYYQQNKGYVAFIVSADDNSSFAEIVPKQSVHQTHFTSSISNNMTFSYIDIQCSNLIGFEASELLRKSLIDFVHIEDVSDVIKCKNDAIKSHQTSICTHRLLTKTNEWLWVHSKLNITYSGQWNSTLTPIVSMCSVATPYDDILKANEEYFSNENLSCQQFTNNRASLLDVQPLTYEIKMKQEKLKAMLRKKA